MDEAHQKDSHTERLCRDAARAIEAVLADENRRRDNAGITAARDELQKRADQIVWSWN